MFSRYNSSSFNIKITLIKSNKQNLFLMVHGMVHDGPFSTAEIVWVKVSTVFFLILIPVLVVEFKSCLKLLLMEGDDSFLQFWSYKPEKRAQYNKA